MILTIDIEYHKLNINREYPLRYFTIFQEWKRVKTNRGSLLIVFDKILIGSGVENNMYPHQRQ